jgi:hypothetical protein
MKSVVSASIDTNVLQEFRMKHRDKKLSSVLNTLLGSYVGSTASSVDEQSLINKRDQLTQKIAKLKAEHVNVETILQKLGDNRKSKENIKERYWREVVQVKVPGYRRERYDECYEQKWLEKATLHSEK